MDFLRLRIYDCEFWVNHKDVQYFVKKDKGLMVRFYDATILGKIGRRRDDTPYYQVREVNQEYEVQNIEEVLKYLEG